MSRKALLLSRTHIVGPNQSVWAIDKASGLVIAPPIYNVAELNPDYQNLLICAPLAFHVIDDTMRFQETLIQALEECGAEHLVGPVLHSQAGLHSCQKASLFGLESLIDKRNKR